MIKLLTNHYFRCRCKAALNLNSLSRRQNNQIVKDVKVCVISICNFNEISNAF